MHPSDHLGESPTPVLPELAEPLTRHQSDVARATVGQHVYDFYCCYKCHRVVTLLEMIPALGADGTGQACPCGGLRYTPMNLPWWGWLMPRVLFFAYTRLRGIPEDRAARTWQRIKAFGRPAPAPAAVRR